MFILTHVGVGGITVYRKLHLVWAGISVSPFLYQTLLSLVHSLSGGSGSGGGEGLGYSKKDGEDDGEEGRNESDEGRPGTKPQLRVFIPGQKEFVPRAVSDGWVGGLLNEVLSICTRYE